jgi:hemerythrin-like metal-binding protein
MGEERLPCPTTTPTLRWTEKYSVNIAALDRQHQRFFETVNRLNEALANGEGRAATLKILSELSQYATNHFAAEEALMAEYRFPGLAAHRIVHEKFIQSIKQFTANHRAGKPGAPVSIMLFLQTWMKEHLLGEDKLYVDFLNARGVR